jgi:hypothetical protein
MRDLLIICHFAMYSGVSDGASGERPCDPSESGADWVGLGGCPWRGAGGGPPALPPPARPNGASG